MVLHMMSYIYSHCRTEGRWLTGVNLQVRTTTLKLLHLGLDPATQINAHPDPQHW
jgi:hypothetical protein